MKKNKLIICLLMIFMPALLTSGCFQTAVLAVSVVNAVDGVSDIAARHEERKVRSAGSWDGRNISDLFVAWGHPGLIYQTHQGNQFGGRSYVWNKTCGPANSGYEGRPMETEQCQVYVHTDMEARIRELNPSPACSLCPDTLKRY